MTSSRADCWKTDQTTQQSSCAKTVVSWFIGTYILNFPTSRVLRVKIGSFITYIRVGDLCNVTNNYNAYRSHATRLRAFGNRESRSVTIIESKKNFRCTVNEALLNWQQVYETADFRLHAITDASARAPRFRILTVVHVRGSVTPCARRTSGRTTCRRPGIHVYA